MRPTVMSIFSLTCVLAMAAGAFGQGDYRVVAVTDGGTVSGTVKWSGPVPLRARFPRHQRSPNLRPGLQENRGLRPPDRRTGGRCSQHRGLPQEHFQRQGD